MKQLKQMMLLATAVVLVSLAACSTTSGEMEVTDVWGRSSPMAAQNGAFYMNITNNTGTDDRLLAVQSDACGVAELHEMYMMEEDVMGMRQVPDGFIPLPAGETVSLEVGGLHVMCLDKQADFTVGSEFPLTLTFETAGEMTVTAEIREMAGG